MENIEKHRKLLHSIFGLIYAIFIYTIDIQLIYKIHILTSLITLVTVIYMSITRHIIIGKTARQTDALPGIGGIMYMLGLSIILIVDYYFNIPKYIIVTSIVTLAVGDPIASIIGKLFYPIGRIEFLKKSIFATILAWIMSCFVVSIICFINDIELHGNILMVTVGSGLLAELFLGYKLIREIAHRWCLDNAIIPIIVIVIGIIIT